mmetsp:Transcript_1353/g.3176  ORF Transcript_1353/g.3176 Transcript_1353/m.3176 type:complete len:134 (+) Transcript_1353:80-481(+)
MEQLEPSFPSLAFVSASSGASSDVTGPGVGTGAGAKTGEPVAAGGPVAAGAGEGTNPGEDAAGTAGAGAGGASLMAAGWVCQMVGDADGVLELRAGNCWELATFAVKGLTGPAWVMLWAGAMLTFDSVTGAGS